MQIANGQISNRSKTKTKSEVIACLLSTLYQIDQSETSLFEVKLLVVIMGLGYCNQCNAYLIDRWSWWSVRWALVTRTWITQYSTNPILVCSWATLKPCVMLSLTKSGTTMAVNESPNHSINCIRIILYLEANSAAVFVLYVLNFYYTYDIGKIVM